jgi:hypothetical protein
MLHNRKTKAAHIRWWQAESGIEMSKQVTVKKVCIKFGLVRADQSYKVLSVTNFVTISVCLSDLGF